MKKKLFVFSDAHGDYKALVEGLEEAGFDKENPNHLLISLGDNFDRGYFSLAIYEFLKNLQNKDKAIIIRGNHLTFLENYLDGTSLSPFNYIYNGTDETLADFLGRSKPFESWCMLDKNIENPTNGDFADFITEAKKEINKYYPELLPWIKSLPYYYETKNYIFTHGAIDTEAKDWHKPHCCRGNLTDWEALAFDDGTFFGKYITNTDKTVVIGHFGTEHLRRLYNIDDGKDKNDILVREDGKVIALDATTCISHKVNILVVEDELE